MQPANRELRLDYALTKQKRKKEKNRTSKKDQSPCTIDNE